MASTSEGVDSSISPGLLEDLKRLLWGRSLTDEVFLRWTQGFVLSADEPTALLQYEGGPCAVIVPVQAFLLRFALFTEENEAVEKWREHSDETAKDLLCQSLSAILLQTTATSYTVVYSDHSFTEMQEQDGPQESGGEEDVQRSPKRRKLCHDQFHLNLRCQQCDSREQLVNLVQSNLEKFQGDFGVLYYLYSLLLTKGVDQIKNEMEDPSEPLIDSTHGHGSQSLINLLLTGKAVSHVFDNEKDVAGMKLHGVSRQSQIGFLTQLEHLRYCEVGFNLKSPSLPVWVLGSETHLTVLFTQDLSLVAPESPEDTARRIFKSFDPEGNGFISSCLLGDVLHSLSLVSDPGYVDIMKGKLDSEGLGIIVLSAFMEEFYPGNNQQQGPKTFTVFHYNGLKRSNSTHKVQYKKGTATILEHGIPLVTEYTDVTTCLQTKWPTISIEWSGNDVPSLN